MRSSLSVTHGRQCEKALKYYVSIKATLAAARSRADDAVGRTPPEDVTIPPAGVEDQRSCMPAASTIETGEVMRDARFRLPRPAISIRPQGSVAALARGEDPGMPSGVTMRSRGRHGADPFGKKFF